MKKYLFMFFLFISIFRILSNEMPTKPNVIILPFSTKGDIDDNFLNLLYEHFVTAVSISSQYNIIEKEKIDETLLELNIQKIDYSNNKSIINIGEYLKADAIIIIDFSYVADLYAISICCIDVKKKVISFKTKSYANNKTNLIISINRIVNQISLNEYDQKFIEKFYLSSWKFEPDNYYKNLSKYTNYMRGGISMIVTASIFISVALTFIPLWIYGLKGEPVLHYSDSGEIYESSPLYPSYLLPFFDCLWIPIASTLIVGIILLALSFIPLFFAYMLKRIYRKTTAGNLSILNKVSLRGFTEKNNINVTNSKVEFSISMDL